MDIRISTFNYDVSELLKCAFDLRSEVFIEELGVDKHLEFDGFDQTAVHYLVTVDGKVAATTRYRETTEGIKIERFAVAIQYRRQAIGLLLLKKLLNDLIPSRKLIYLHATIEAHKFYENHGFTVEGDEFFEANIIHYKMIYKR